MHTLKCFLLFDMVLFGKVKCSVSQEQAPFLFILHYLQIEHPHFTICLPFAVH